MRCHRCKTAGAEPDRSRCEPCRKICAARAKLWREKQRSVGLCLEINCPHPPVVGFIYCEKHREYQKVRRNSPQARKARARLVNKRNP